MENVSLRNDDPRPRRYGTLFWRVMDWLLIIGLIAFVVGKFLSKDVSESWIGLVLGTFVLAGAFALGALLLRLISRGTELLRALAAMWRPIALVLAAAYLLFAFPQGRELGVSLMAEKSGFRLFFLFLALIYWAANNWHTARLGLHDAIERGKIPKPQGDEKWLFWPPRLIGVCAHLFAAVNLSLAAQNQPLFAGTRLWLVPWTAPLVIITTTVLVWQVDRAYLSRRIARKVTISKLIGIGAIAAVLLSCAIAAFEFPAGPAGFLWGTFWISASAIVFLVGISLLRRRKPLSADATLAERDADKAHELWEISLFTQGLFAIAVAFAFATWISPIAVGRTLGSMVVAYFALGAILSLVNFLGFAIERTTANGWFGAGATPRVIGAYAVVLLIGLAVVNAWLRPFHQVRLCDGDDCIIPKSAAGLAVVTSVEHRPTVAAAARAWYDQAKAAYSKANGEGPVPMVVVATAGGGIRAAYWTADILEKLSSDFQDVGGVRPYLFAISGVSGGSVGATVFDAALAQRDENECTAGDAKCPLATSFLTEDFLAPALASWVFVDAPSSFLPNWGQIDRGTALEKGFEHASGGMLTRPFLSLFPYQQTAADKRPAPWRPILLLNGTHEETGKRIITGHVLIERNVFIDSLDTLHLLARDMRASTAAHNSARFTWVSPAGDLGDRHGSVIDGGYFENYGALSALEIARAARWELRDEKPGVKLIVLMISSDPDLSHAHELVRIKEADDHGSCLVSVAAREAAPSTAADAAPKPNYLSVDKGEVQNAWLNEFLAPFTGIKNVREAHGNRAAAELAVQICSEYPEPPKPSPPAAEASQPTPTPQPALTVQTQTAGTLDKAKNVVVGHSDPVKANQASPYFAHLAMCTEGTPPPVQPPLGWVLSSATRKAFDDLLTQCGNDRELHQLEVALGKKQEQTVAR